MSFGRSFNEQFSGMSLHQNYQRKPQELSSPGGSKSAIGSMPGSMKSGLKMGYKDDDLDEDLNSQLYFKSQFQQRPNDRDISQQNLSSSLYGNHQQQQQQQQQGLSSQNQQGFFNNTGGSLNQDPSDLWSRGSTSQVGSHLSKAGISSFSTLQTPLSNSRGGIPSSSQYSRSISQPGASNDRFSSFQTNNTGLGLSSSNNPFGSSQNTGHISPVSRGLLPMGPKGTIGGQLPSASGSSGPSQSLLNSSLQKPNRSSPLSAGLGSMPTSGSGNYSGFSMPRSQSGGPSSMQGLLTPMTTTSLAMAFSSGDGLLSNASSNNSFDLDFPALANRITPPMPSSGTSQGSSLPSRPGYVMVANKSSVPTNQEPFQIHNEDFPALPGTPATDAPAQLEVSKQQGGGLWLDHTSSDLPNTSSPNSVGLPRLYDSIASYGVGSSYDQVLRDGRPVGEKKPRALSTSGIQTLSSGVITNIPSGMVTDQFGMIGLLTFIRAAETEPNLVTLALGSDLTTLGLNLNSSESLFYSFGSPFWDSTCKPHELDFSVPKEYLITPLTRDKLAPIKLSRYGEDLLFYLYYTCSGDLLQLAAASELFSRDWRFHKEDKVWITRAPGMQPQMKTNTYERGTYCCFDPQLWQKVMKDFHVDYDKLEERPTYQQTQQQQQQQQQPQQQQQQQPVL